MTPIHVATAMALSSLYVDEAEWNWPLYIILFNLNSWSWIILGW